jgi:hypothetical protein
MERGEVEGHEASVLANEVAWVSGKARSVVVSMIACLPSAGTKRVKGPDGPAFRGCLEPVSSERGRNERNERNECSTVGSWRGTKGSMSIRSRFPTRLGSSSNASSSQIRSFSWQEYSAQCE